MFDKSYNATHLSKTIEEDAVNSNGYSIKWSIDENYSFNIVGLNTNESLYVINSNERSYAMWLATGSSYSSWHTIIVNSNGTIKEYDSGWADPGFRPIICLSSSVKLIDNGDGTYRIK